MLIKPSERGKNDNIALLWETPNKLRIKHVHFLALFLSRPGETFAFVRAIRASFVRRHLSLSNQAGPLDSSCWPEEGLCSGASCTASKRKWLFQTSLSLSFPLSELETSVLRYSSRPFFLEVFSSGRILNPRLPAQVSGPGNKGAVWVITAIITTFLQAYKLSPCEKAQSMVRRFSMLPLHWQGLSSPRPWGGFMTPAFPPSFTFPPRLARAGERKGGCSLPVGRTQDMENKESSSDPLHTNPQFVLEQSWNSNSETKGLLKWRLFTHMGKVAILVLKL